MKELSIFVDESGDFGEYEKHSPYYIVTLVFHNQSKDISANIKSLNHSLKQMGYGDGQAIHTAPLIRREKPYQFYKPNERRSIFSKLYYFTLNCDIKYKSFIFRKNELKNNLQLETKISKDLSLFIQKNLSYFQSFEKVILYYDNGQHELNRILNAALSSRLADYETRKVLPSDYRLFQVADLICTLELLKIKSEKESLSNSELKLFHSKRDLQKDFIRGIEKKEF